MAVDSAILDSYKNGYGIYLNDLKAKNITGKDYDQVEHFYNRMLELAEECNDRIEFQAKLDVENVLGNFYCAYSQAIANDNTNKINANLNQKSSLGGAFESTPASSKVENAIDTVTQVASPLVYRIPIVGILLVPITSLVKWTIRIVSSSRERRKNKKAGNTNSGVGASTHVKRTN